MTMVFSILLMMTGVVALLTLYSQVLIHLKHTGLYFSKMDFWTYTCWSLTGTGILISGISMGFHKSLLWYLPIISFWLVVALKLYQIYSSQRLRPRCCQQCGFKMVRVSLSERYLTQQQKIEEQIKSQEYDLWICTCGERELFVYPGSQAKHYQKCSICNVRGVYRTRQVTTPQGVVFNEGECIACHSEYKALESVSYVANSSLSQLQFK